MCGKMVQYHAHIIQLILGRILEDIKEYLHEQERNKFLSCMSYGTLDTMDKVKKNIKK